MTWRVRRYYRGNFYLGASLAAQFLQVEFACRAAHHACIPQFTELLDFMLTEFALQITHRNIPRSELWSVAYFREYTPSKLPPQIKYAGRVPTKRGRAPAYRNSLIPRRCVQ